MGTSGIEQFCALPRTQTRSIDDPYCHQTPCTSLGASEAAEDVPWHYEDMPNDAVKGWVGGDNGQLRAMYGGQFEAPILPKFFVPSNFPLKHNSNDKAWACPKVGRLRCALSMDAAFRADIAEDDPEKGIYKADDGDDLQKFYDQRRHGCLLLLLEFAREFAAAGFVLPFTPDSVAKRSIEEAGTCADFIKFIQENYESTALPNGHADYATHGKETACRYTEILSEYNKNDEGKTNPLGKKDAVAALTEIGHKPKVINNPAHGFNGLGGVGVLLKRKRDEPH